MNTFLVEYAFDQEKLNDLIGMMGNQPPGGQNVKVLGAWNQIGPRRGFAVIESEKLEDLARFLEQWVNHIEMEVVPVKNAWEIWK